MKLRFALLLLVMFLVRVVMVSAEFTTSSFQSPDIPYGAQNCIISEDGLVTGYDTGDTNPNDSVVNKWNGKLSSSEISGTTWIGKLFTNGYGDNLSRVDTGRETIVFIPCTTNLSKSVELVYFLHGNDGFDDGTVGTDDMGGRVLKQAKEMSDAGRNFVIVFPELPWSAGNDKTRKNNNEDIGDESGIGTDFIFFHDDILRILNELDSGFQDSNVALVSMTGHSRGGSALKWAAKSGAMESINVGKITFSDADYGSQTTSVWNNYISKQTNSVELNMLVQDPYASGLSPHNPTWESIDFVQKVLDNSLWTYRYEGVIGDGESDPLTYACTPGAEIDHMTKSVKDGHVINYVPLNKKHLDIGAMSLAWISSDTSTYPLASSTAGQDCEEVSVEYDEDDTSHRYASNEGYKVSTAVDNYPQDCQSSTTCQELDEVWNIISKIVFSESAVKFLAFNEGVGAWIEWDDLYSVATESSISSSGEIGLPLNPMVSVGCWGKRNPVGSGDGCHDGIDLSVSRGTDIYSIADGIVSSARVTCVEGDKQCGGRGGNSIVIKHIINGIEYESVYAHLSNVHVKVNEEIKKGQIIGKVGNTGDSTGPHLHFAVRYTKDSSSNRGINPICFYRDYGWDLSSYYGSCSTTSGCESDPRDHLTAKKVCSG